jgi:hypothetical protein
MYFNYIHAIELIINNMLRSFTVHRFRASLCVNVGHTTVVSAFTFLISAGSYRTQQSSYTSHSSFLQVATEHNGLSTLHIPHFCR